MNIKHSKTSDYWPQSWPPQFLFLEPFRDSITSKKSSWNAYTHAQPRKSLIGHPPFLFLLSVQEASLWQTSSFPNCHCLEWTTNLWWTSHICFSHPKVTVPKYFPDLRLPPSSVDSSDLHKRPLKSPKSDQKKDSKGQKRGRERGWVWVRLFIFTAVLHAHSRKHTHSHRDTATWSTQIIYFLQFIYSNTHHQV